MTPILMALRDVALIVGATLVLILLYEWRTRRCC